MPDLEYTVNLAGHRGRWWRVGRYIVVRTRSTQRGSGVSKSARTQHCMGPHTVPEYADVAPHVENVNDPLPATVNAYLQVETMQREQNDDSRDRGFQVTRVTVHDN